MNGFCCSNRSRRGSAIPHRCHKYIDAITKMGLRTLQHYLIVALGCHMMIHGIKTLSTLLGHLWREPQVTSGVNLTKGQYYVQLCFFWRTCWPPVKLPVIWQWLVVWRQQWWHDASQILVNTGSSNGLHYRDVIMDTMASQITSLTIVY